MTNTITFDQPARRVFAVVKHVLQTMEETPRHEPKRLKCYTNKFTYYGKQQQN